MTERTICVVTGSRAEYGLLYWLMKEIEADPEMVLQLVVTGAHLDAKFGGTVEEIQRDGFTVHARVATLEEDDTALGVAKAMGKGVAGMAGAFDRLKPDVAVIHGDRYEILAAAQAAMVLDIPIAHVSGGELTEGAMDDAMRHAITKMSHLHFTAAEAFRDRVIQMGEAPERVFAVGAAGLDAIANLDLLDWGQLETALGHGLGERFFVVTYHPVTLEKGTGNGVEELLAALDGFPDHRVLITGVNADPGHDRIFRLLEAHAEKRRDRVFIHQSLGQVRYLSAVKLADAVVGNSSSGIIEAPALGTPTVNMGSRQKGRPLGPSVFGCGETRAEIAAAIGKALSADSGSGPDAIRPLYGSPGASRRIKEILKSVNLEGILIKRFHDMKAGPCP